jgi:hypothetical protein
VLWAPYLNQSFRRRVVALLDRYDSSVPVSFYVIAVLVITIGCVLAAIRDVEDGPEGQPASRSRKGRGGVGLAGVRARAAKH